MLVLKKVMRFILKSISILLVLVLLLGIVAFFAIRSSSFQTWAAQKASNYLSKELGTTVSIGKVEIDFFNSVLLKDALVKDLHNDTLLSGGSIETRIRHFDYKNQSFQLQEVRLKNTTIKLQKHKTDTIFNYQFLVDYFAGGKKSETPQKPWNIAYGDLIFDDVNFMYRNAHKDTSVTSNINYNAIYAQHIYGKINEYKQDNDTFYATITDFKLKEQCGFVVNQLNTRVKISEQILQCNDLFIKTPQTYINGNLRFDYKNWDDYSDFITNVKMKAEFTDSTHVNAKDIATFAPELNGLNETIYIKGKVNGYVNDLNLTNTTLRYRAFTEFTGDLSISGLPDMDNCYLHFKTSRLSTNYKDLIQIPDYPFTKNTKLQIPSKLAVLGTVAYKGTFDGLLNDFTTYGNFSTALGNIRSDLSIQLEKTTDIRYQGKIKTRNFNIGVLAGLRDLGALSLDAKVKGKGLSLKDLDTEVEGKIQALTYKGYMYKNMILNGSIQNKIFNGLFESLDPNAQFDFNGNIDFTNKIPKLDFISTINAINPRALKLVTSGDTGVLSSQVLINLSGDDINNLSGEINFDGTQYKTSKKTYKLSTFDLQLDQNTPIKK